MNMKPHISIIICTYSRARLLKRTLMSLGKLMDIGKAEVIVVDNNSSDNTKNIVYLCTNKLKGRVNVRYVLEPRQGLSAARNTGIEEASAPIIAFLDDDAVPYINWLPSITNAFYRYSDAAAIGGAILPEFAVARPSWLVESLELKYTIVNLGDRSRKYPRRLYPFGANMAFRREALGDIRFPEELGRKGSSLLSGEETAVFQQLRKKDLQLYYIPTMRVRHHIAEDRLTKEWIKRRYYYQGVSAAMGGRSLFNMIRIVTTLIFKKLYIAIHKRVKQSPDHDLMRDCHRESIRGSMDTLRLKGVTRSYE